MEQRRPAAVVLPQRIVRRVVELVVLRSFGFLGLSPLLCGFTWRGRGTEAGGQLAVLGELLRRFPGLRLLYYPAGVAQLPHVVQRLRALLLARLLPPGVEERHLVRADLLLLAQVEKRKQVLRLRPGHAPRPLQDEVLAPVEKVLLVPHVAGVEEVVVRVVLGKKRGRGGSATSDLHLELLAQEKKVVGPILEILEGDLCGFVLCREWLSERLDEQEVVWVQLVVGHVSHVFVALVRRFLFRHEAEEVQSEEDLPPQVLQIPLEPQCRDLFAELLKVQLPSLPRIQKPHPPEQKVVVRLPRQNLQKAGERVEVGRGREHGRVEARTHGGVGAVGIQIEVVRGVVQRQVHAGLVRAESGRRGRREPASLHGQSDSASATSRAHSPISTSNSKRPAPGCFRVVVVFYFFLQSFLFFFLRFVVLRVVEVSAVQVLAVDAEVVEEQPRVPRVGDFVAEYAELLLCPVAVVFAVHRHAAVGEAHVREQVRERAVP
mmetsp:Transcript_26380/g.66533  ORF Transcript_26380/g.66533 Transcript_26380/m.66533 type:complete len:490 (-) Transcript_26380:5248-6717(-)